jgi:hypothetical protein
MENQTKTKSQMWEERLSAFLKSGLSQRQFCTQKQIPINTFQFWKKKLRDKQGKAVFVKIDNNFPEEKHVEIINHNGIRIILNEQVPDETAYAVLKAVRSGL